MKGGVILIKKELKEKTINFKTEESLYKEIKVKIAEEGITLKDYVTNLKKKDLKGGKKVSKENNYINLSEDYELNYALKRNGKSETELNRNLLKIEIETYKMENDVSNIRHDEVDKIISNSDGYEVKD